ncbi:hypothetical protein BJ741DRAFT_589692 [Chytriomyces cf. hyalinus JEL632]|nr:hypothetical protein BJ741DRAFT_589692 [Chytriomyces cf. hyalinus JEL632]
MTVTTESAATSGAETREVRDVNDKDGGDNGQEGRADVQGMNEMQVFSAAGGAEMQGSKSDAVTPTGSSHRKDKRRSAASKPAIVESSPASSKSSHADGAYEDEPLAPELSIESESGTISDSVAVQLSSPKVKTANTKPSTARSSTSKRAVANQTKSKAKPITAFFSAIPNPISASNSITNTPMKSAPDQHAHVYVELSLDAPNADDIPVEVGASSSAETVINIETAKQQNDESVDEMIIMEDPESVTTNIRNDEVPKDDDSSSPPVSVPTFTSALVRFEKGKLVFKEKKMALDRHPATISELNAFHTFKSEIIASKNWEQVDKFPTQFYPLLAKLVQDSNKPRDELAKQIRNQILPELDDEDDEEENDDGDSELNGFLQESMISDAISDIAIRINYGLDVNDVILEDYAIWRWEVVDKSLLGEFSSKAEARVATRQQAAKDAARLFQSIPESERASILQLGVKRDTVLPSERPHPILLDTSEEAQKASKKSITKEKKLAAQKLKDELKEKKEQEKREAKEEAKRKKEEKQALEKVKEEQKRQKKEEERVKAEKAKEDAKLKKETSRGKVEKSQPSLFGFIVRSKKETPAPPVHTNEADAALTLFRERFLPFHVKSGVEVAKHNRFMHDISNDYAVEIHDQISNLDFSSNFTAFLKSESRKFRENARKAHVAKMKARRDSLRKQQAVTIHSSAPTMLADLFDTETTAAAMDVVMDEEGDPFAKFRECRWKFLKFQEDYRPPYFGTWTKKSRVIKGKNPWAKDVGGGVLNYEVDSEAEWEEDEPGEELQSEDEEDDGAVSGPNAVGTGGEADGEELDDWLVPDGYLSEDEADGEDGDKAGRQGDKSFKEVIQKKIGPLVPVVLSLFGDNNGTTMEAGLDNYEMVWMADIGSVDPFTFKRNSPLAVVSGSQHGKNYSGGKSLSKALKANSEKHIFDDANLEALVQLVDGSSLSLGKLVEVTKEKFPSVSKVQMELKIRHIAVKEKRDGEDKSHWHIKDEYDHLCADEALGGPSLKRKIDIAL